MPVANGTRFADILPTTSPTRDDIQREMHNRLAIISGLSDTNHHVLT